MSGRSININTNIDTDISMNSDGGGRNINIVITMGGLGSRFRKAGWTVPKYMIEAKGKTLFEWSMLSLEGFREDAARYIFIAMEDPACDAEAFIREKCKLLGIGDPCVIMLDHLTDGQATTAMKAAEYWDRERPLLIYNIDTYVEPGAMNGAELGGDGFIPCFRAEGTHWSFVRLDGSGRAVEVREKDRISDHCTVGAYYFRTCALYEELYREFYGAAGGGIAGEADDESAAVDRGEDVGTAGLPESGAARDGGNGPEAERGPEPGAAAGPERIVSGESRKPALIEKYVAPLYNYLISKGGAVYISDIPPAQVHVLGTPEELRAFLEDADC